MNELKVRTLIQVDDRGVFSGSAEPNWKNAIVTDLLSTQFTCIMAEGKDRPTFLFYRDRGDTWRFKP